MEEFRPGRLVVFIREIRHREGFSPYCEGPILYMEEPLKAQIEESADVGDLNFEESIPPVKGLLIWEGWIEWTPGEDPDMMLVGEWRKLTHWEMCHVREGRPPWEQKQEALPERTRDPRLGEPQRGLADSYECGEI